MSLNSTRSKVSSNPRSNDSVLVGEGDERRTRDLPIEQVEVKDPNLIPKNEPIDQVNQESLRKKITNDYSIQNAIQISSNLKDTLQNIGSEILANQTLNRTASNLNQTTVRSSDLIEQNKTKLENRINLVSGNAKAVKVREINTQKSIPIKPIKFDKTLVESSNFFEKFNNQFFNSSNVQSTFVPEAKVLAMIDLSKMSSQEIEELLIARKFESELDEKMLKSLFSIMQSDQKNADYLYELETQITEEIKAAESYLNTISSFQSLIDSTIKSLFIEKNSKLLYDKLQEKLSFYNFAFSSNQEMQIEFQNDFIKVFEKLNAMQNASKVDPQFLIWKNLKSISDFMINGVSNRFLIEEQPKQGFTLDYLNFDYDGTFSSFEQFKIMNLDGFEPMDRVFYYINSMCNELNQSIGLGELQVSQGPSIDGDDWLKKNLGVKSSWRVSNPSGYYSNLFVKDPSNETRPQLSLNSIGAFNYYLLDFKTNIKSNSYQNYDSSLLKSLQEFQAFEQNVLKITNNQDSKKKLLKPNFLFKRIIEAFNEIVGSIDQSNIGSQNVSNTDKLLSLVLMSMTAGSLTGNKLKLKHQIFNTMMSSLEKIRNERKSNDLKLSFSSKQISIDECIDTLKKVASSSSFEEFSFRFELSDMQELLNKIGNGTLKNNIVFHKVLEIFLELEKECIDTVNRSRSNVQFLIEGENKTGKTKFSNLDASKFCYMLYEIFCILIQVFFQFTFNSEFKIKCNIISDEIKQALKTLPKCLEKDEFQSFFDSLKTFTVNDNIGFRTNVYGGIVTANSIYDVNESFKKEQATLIYHLASIKTTIENFVKSTNDLHNYTKILKLDPSIQESSLTSEQKNLKKFLSTKVGIDFIHDVSNLKIARARLRLLKLKSLLKPYDLAFVPSSIYDALIEYIKKNDKFKNNNLMFLASLDKEILKNLVNTDFNNRFKMNLRITKVNELQDVQYEPFIFSNIPLGYCLTKELLNESIENAKLNGINDNINFDDLIANMKFFDMANSTILNSVEMKTSTNISDESERTLVDSYFATILIETIARLDLDMPGTFKNDISYNVDVAKKMLDMAGLALGFNDAFNAIFKLEGNEIFLKNKEEIQRSLDAEVSFVTEKGTILQLNDGFDFAKIDLLHTLLDTIYLRKGKLNDMIFTDNNTAQIFGITFDPQNFVYENDFKPTDDNEIRFDSFYLDTEFIR